MDPRRRSVMQPTPDPYNMRTGIPMPHTASKPPPSSRLSVAGPAMRPPATLAVPSTNPRQSIMRSSQNNPLLASTSKQGYGRTPVPKYVKNAPTTALRLTSNHIVSSTRRGSMWPGAGPAPLATGNQIIKDTRPLRDKAYQSKMRQDVHSYLNASSIDISMSTLVNMSGKEYKAIFEELVLMLDPAYPFRDGARLEEEFVPALKTLGYPFAHTIDHKWLAAVASPHSWPSLLGVLHWLVELCKLRDEYLSSRDPTVQDPAAVPPEFDDPLDHKALAFNYCERAYDMWMGMADDFTELNQQMDDRYNKKNEKVQVELDSKKKELSQKKTTYNELKGQVPNLEALQADNAQYRKDKDKWERILPKDEERIRKLIQDIAREQADIEKQGEILMERKKALAQYKETVASQNISQEEAIRMRSDTETLTQGLEDLKQKIAETRNTMLSNEVIVTNRSAAAEDALDSYNNLLTSLDLFPPLPPPWQDIDLTLELNTASSKTQELLVGADIKTIIKPTLQAVAEQKRVERAEIETQRIKIDNEIDQLANEYENLEYDVAEIVKKATILGDEADGVREVAQRDALEASTQSSQLTHELAQARNAAMANGLGAQTRLKKLEFSFKEQEQKVNRLKEETIRAILKNSQDIALFKQEVSRHLQELRNFADAEQ